MRAAHTIIYVMMLLCLTSINSEAQIGKKFKEKLKKATDAVSNPTEFARSAAVNSLKEAKAEFDSSSFGYAISFSDNAGLFESKETGERVQTGVLFLLQKDEEKEPYDVAMNYMDAGEIAYASNKFRSAEVSFYASKLIFEGNAITSNINYPRLIADLGLLNHTMGRYSMAREFTEDAIELRGEILGEESVAYGVSLNNRAILNKDMGKYNEAEKDLNQAISIISSKVESDDASLAILYNNKAMLYQSLGRYDEAIELMNTSLSISEEALGSKSVNHQRLMTNLAILYQMKGDYNLAEEKFLEVIELKEKRLGKNHPDYAHMITNLASLYLEMGREDEVEELLMDAGDIYEKKFGKEHPSYASYQANLGNFYRYKGDFDKADPFLRGALVTRAKTLGDNHPDYVQSQEDYAILLWDKGDREEAMRYYGPAMDKTMDFIETFFPPMSEAEKTRYWDKLHPRFQRFYAFSTTSENPDSELLLKTFNYRAATKALILNSSQKLREEILSGEDESLKQNYLDWIDTKEMLAGYYSYSKEDLNEQKVNIDSLEDVANEKERYLSANSSLFKEGYLGNAYDFNDIQNALSETEAVIDILQVQEFDRKFTGNSTYYALIVKNGDENPKMVKIGTSEELDDKYFKYYRNSIRLKTEDAFSYNKFFSKIDQELNESQTIYISKDGIYHQVSLGTLRNPNGQFLVEYRYPILVTNTADIVDIKSEESKEKISNATLVGYPEYGDNGQIAPLPGTEKEVNNIQSILTKNGISSTVIGGPEATESNIKAIENPDILHIATHGYFLKDEEGGVSDRVFGVNPEQAKDNPLLRSGLMLNGAGYTFEGQSHRDLTFNDNGILTAFEALNMKLDNTSLVVLSACETGLGDIKAGEGVYGLQRSFLVAGVNNLIMSLWKVDDNSTQKLMTEFYKNYAQTGNVDRSFNLAQKALKTEFPDPYYWGAFVMIRK